MASHARQRQGPRNKAPDGRDGAGGDDISSSDRRTNVLLLGTPTENLDIVEPKGFDDLVQKSDAPKERLNQLHSEIRAGDRQGDPRKAGTRADIDNTLPVVDNLGQHRAVEDVTVPESPDLTRTDKATDDSGVPQPTGIINREAEAVSEDRLGFRGRGGDVVGREVLF